MIHRQHYTDAEIRAACQSILERGEQLDPAALRALGIRGTSERLQDIAREVRPIKPEPTEDDEEKASKMLSPDRLERRNRLRFRAVTRWKRMKLARGIGMGEVET